MMPSLDPNMEEYLRRLYQQQPQSANPLGDGLSAGSAPPLGNDTFGKGDLSPDVGVGGKQGMGAPSGIKSGLAGGLGAISNAFSQGGSPPAPLPQQWSGIVKPQFQMQPPTQQRPPNFLTGYRPRNSVVGI